MTLYIQHGYGKSDKIQTALGQGSADGVILSPRHEKPEKLGRFVEELRNDHDCEILFDPQCYVSALPAGKVGYLNEYDYFTANLSAAQFSLRRIRQIVELAIQRQLEIGVTTLIAPTVIAERFDDRWFQIAITMADAALEYCDTLSQHHPLLLSFAITEEAFADQADVDRFLDTVTQDGWTMEGIYLLTPRARADYHQGWHTARLENLLYAVHVLGEINDLRVVLGYHDFCGLPLRAAGARAFAMGWSQSLRQFLLKNFMEQDKTGGQPPRPRYSSGPLMNSIFLDELQEICEAGLMDTVLTGVPLDDVITDAPNPHEAEWTMSIAQQHHWQTLRSLDRRLSGNARREVPRMLRQIREAQGVYRALQNEGIQFSRFTGPDHLANWTESLSAFARRIGIAS